jgi:hypothetical protein
MESVSDYRQQVKLFLQDFAADDPHTQVVFDSDNDHYLVIHNAWHNNSRTYGCAIHLDIIDGQVWIQHNSTKIAIDQELQNRGIAKADIVLGFRSPSVRSLLTQMSA